MSAEDQKDWFDTNFDIWYNYVKESTFKTVMIELTDRDLFLLLKENVNFTSDENERIIQLMGVNIMELDSIKRDDFRNRVNEAIRVVSPNSTGCFIKLSCRSPKDAFAVCDKMQQLYREETEKHSDPLSENEKLIIVNESFIHSMKVHSFDEEFHYLCQSGRVLEDLMLHLAQGQSRKPLQLIVREWVDIPIKYEFRGFVFGKKLVAISQYFDNCFFKDLVEESGQVRERLITFFNQWIVDRVPLENYICDFAIGYNGRVYIVELNPYAQTTDSCLFNVSLYESNNTK